jgi:hypothetical protein
LTGLVDDPTSGDPPAPANVAAFDWRSDQAIASAASDAGGRYSLTVPAGSANLALRVTDPAATRFLETVHLRPAFDPDQPEQELDLAVMRHSTVVAFPAFVGVTQTIEYGLAGGEVVDCNGDRVFGAVVSVSDTSLGSAHVPDAWTFYYSAGTSSVPVRNSSSATTNNDGLFVVLNVPPRDEAYIQAWGYLDGQTPGTDEVTLLAEVKTATADDVWMYARLAPRRAE